MNEKNVDELRYRRLAFRLFDQGKSAAASLKRVPRSRTWLFKWKKRFEQKRGRALDRLSRAPKRAAKRYDRKGVKRVLRLRPRLQQAEGGLSGARAVGQELRAHRLLRTLPALSTLKRWLKAAGLRTREESTPKPAFSPAPTFAPALAFCAGDWTARYLQGGEKGFVFPPVDLQTPALGQSSSGDKSTASVCAPLLQVCAPRGVPDFRQLDNAAAFTGLGKTPGVGGRFVRLALYLGLALVFSPPGEPHRTSLVAGRPQLGARSFWSTTHCASRQAFQRQSPQFLAWDDPSAPPALHGLTVKEARLGAKRRKLPPRALTRLPLDLPLTAGRGHCLRRVNAQGRITLRNAEWQVSRSGAGA